MIVILTKIRYFSEIRVFMNTGSLLNMYAWVLVRKHFRSYIVCYFINSEKFRNCILILFIFQTTPLTSTSYSILTHLFVLLFTLNPLNPIGSVHIYFWTCDHLLEHGWPTRGYILRENWLCQFWQLSITNSYSVRAYLQPLLWDFVCQELAWVLCMLSKQLCVTALGKLPLIVFWFNFKTL